MKLKYRTLGEGKPFIILHGLFGSSDNWQSHAKQLANGYKVYLVDQANHGHAEHVNDCNYNLLADDLLELFAEEGLRDAILLGHSMGGKTAMRFAQSHAFLLEKLIVADMGIKAYPRHHDTIFQGLFNVQVENVPDRKTAEERLRKFVSEPSTVQFLMKNLYWKEPGKMAWRFNLPVLFDKIDRILEALPKEKILCETLMIIGGKSGYVPESDFKSIHDLIPQVTFDVISNAGHWVHAEAPSDFMASVNRFVGIH